MSKKEYIEMDIEDIEDYFEFAEDFNFYDLDELFILDTYKDKDKIEKIMKLLPNTIWTRISVNGCVSYVNEYNGKGTDCFFPGFTYDPKIEYLAIDKNSNPHAEWD